MEKYQTGGDVGTRTGVESSLSPYAGPYVTEMFGMGHGPCFSAVSSVHGAIICWPF